MSQCAHDTIKHNQNNVYEKEFDEIDEEVFNYIETTRITRSRPPTPILWGYGSGDVGSE